MNNISFSFLISVIMEDLEDMRMEEEEKKRKHLMKKKMRVK